ncbi:MAG TPA: DNA polymerase III subunit gamma and tau [Mycobacteriales bacterium]|jgi:DNA polymerase-3 subunit gamma/tau|nr:DNA polymerase III subunit gamma and tau [Mycobacteriales bacterium]
MSLALYRKYRPGSFAEVVGQEHVTEPICAALDSGRIHHAYLFSGPRGCGKTSSARILARSLNCEKGPTSTPCGECDSCVALAPMGAGSLDVIEIDAASHGLVDDARDLRERAFFAPVSSRFKVYVIDEAHMITSAAFNALLKVVEEPPPHVKFVFATTEPDKVLTTIKSRTFHYRFRLIPPHVMRDHLADLAAREGIQVDPLVLPLVVRAGAGSARDAQSILDQLAAGSGGELITYERALSLLGYTDAALLDDAVDAFAMSDGAAVFAAIDRVIEAGLDPRRFAQDLLERFRDLLVLDAVPDAADAGLIDAPTDALDRMRGQASQLGRAALSHAADVMATALVDMRGTTSPRLVLELACARVLLPAATDDTAALLARLDRLEKRVSATAQPAATAAPAPAPTATVEQRVAAPVRPEPVAEPAPMVQEGKPAPVARAVPAAVEPGPPAEPEAAVPAAAPGAIDLPALRRLWDSVLDAIKTQSRTAHALMMSSQIESLDGNNLVVAFSSQSLASRFAADVAPTLTQALKEVVGIDLRVTATGGGAPAPRSTGSSPEPATGTVPEMSADDIEDSDDLEDSVEADPEAAALALLQDGLGAQVIGEIDQS